MPNTIRALPLLLALTMAACPDDTTTSTPDGTGGPPPPTTTVPLADGAYTYILTEGTASLPLWTTPVTRKLRTQDRAPGTSRSGLSLSAARNEFEPVQLVIGPVSGSATVEAAPFPNLGAGQRVELAVVGYHSSGWVETLTPLPSGGSVDLNPDAGVPVWLTVFVPADAPAGEHTTNLTVTAGGETVSVPVTLTVFDFAIPRQASFATQLNVNVSNLVGDGSVDDAKTLLFEHRLTPKSVTWPSGFKWNITWDNGAAPNPCEAFYDEPDEGAAFSIGALSKKYILGNGWNDLGFPTAMLFQFIDNSTPRPGTLCGLDRGDHYGSDAYNAEWSQWLGALDGYLVANGMADRGYYYVQNEPQNAEDEALAAHLCRITRAAAPNLKIAVSEEPKPSIAEDPGGACGYDIWIAHTRAYQQGYAWERQRDHGEVVWYYSLDHDPDPYFNPTDIERDGMHQRVIAWAAWSHRIRGWAYYDADRFFDGMRPGVRAALLRESFEDYEYLLLANGGTHPEPFATEAADATAASVASSMTSWVKDADALMALRHELGRYIEGSTDTLPVLQADTGARPRGAYYVNFQDPGGEPSDDPLEVDGQTWMKVGWGTYDEEKGYGWAGEHVDNPSIALYGMAGSGGSVVERSYIYDDYGRDNLFEFALEPGRYEVTVAVGRVDRPYPGQPHNLTVEGFKLVDDVPTTDAEPQLVRTTTVDLMDGSLSLVVGGRSEAIGDFSYTFIAYMTVVPVD